MVVALVGPVSAAAASTGALGGPQASAVDDGGGGGGGDDGGGGDGGGGTRHRTSTALSCLVVELVAGTGTICTATVRDTAASPTDLGGGVTFSSTDPADFPSPKTCQLQSVEGQFRCSIQFEPSGPGVRVLTVAYEGDSGHTPGTSTPVEITVTVPTGGEGDGGGGDDGGGGGDGGGDGGNGGGGGDPSPPPPPPVAPPTPPAAGSPPTSVPAPSMPPPNTTLTRKPPRKTAGRWAKFTIASDQAGSTFECKLDGAPFKACAGAFQANVRRGRHTLQVRAISSDGMADPTPAMVRWKVR
jgi:hypothetical protein